MTVQVQAAATATGSGFSRAAFTEGCLAYSDREYQFHGIPDMLAGLIFTRIAGGAAPGSVKISATATDSGEIYAFSADADVLRQLTAAGWGSFKFVPTSFPDIRPS